MPQPDDEPDAIVYRVPALERGLAILEMFSASERVLSLGDMAARLKLTQSAIYRIVQTMTERGYLRKTARTSFELGPRVLSNGFTWLASRDIVEIAMPWLNALRDRTSLSCHLSIREHTDALYIYRAFAQQRLTANIPIGSRLPCHGTAMGRMLLCDLNDAELGALYRNIRLDDYPPPAPKSFLELRQILDEDRRSGWAVSRSDYSTSVAAPIRDHLGRITAAINLSGPDAIMHAPGFLEHARALLLECAATIAGELGYKNPDDAQTPQPQPQETAATLSPDLVGAIIAPDPQAR
ncbi:MAG: IclR family transcriptional regulator [Burkholderiaceae bacterium]|jgi:DNA-binding IclR family transcriptional regulator|nr:IclR family transcriptional regulator [Burkholderiaceae bacterium]